mgnify:FL=1
MISNKEQYISLSTRKKDGSFVDTPVWFAQDGTTKSFYLYSVKEAGKIKRIRNFAAVKIAHCNYRGKLKGDWVDATAELIHAPEGIQLAYSHLRKKYGIKFRIGDLFSWLTGNIHRRQFLKISIKTNDA